MLKVPEITDLDMAFGKIDHMPKYSAVPDEFKSDSNPFSKAISSWFFRGAKTAPNGIEINGTTFTARPGIDARSALAAIRSVMSSFEPKHEHKEAGCAFMLSEWFEIQPAAAEKKRA